MRRPDLFLLGAPKSGSTALYAYLNEHPDIWFPRLKEPRFFADDDLGDFREITTLQAYEALYRKAPARARIVGDGSPWYLCSRTAAGAIREYAPAARGVVLLRNPLEMLPSLHNQFVFSYKETETDLRRAWRLQEARLRGRHLPPSSPAPALLQYGALTQLGRQLENLLQIWPHEQLHVVLFEDFTADTRTEYVKILAFLGLPDDGRTDFPVINEAARRKHAGLGWWISSPASPVRRTIRRVQAWTGLRSTGVLGPLLRPTVATAPRQALDPDFRRELAEFYRPDVQLLSRLLDRDLSHWLEE